MAKISQFGKAKFGQAIFGGLGSAISSTPLTVAVSDDLLNRGKADKVGYREANVINNGGAIQTTFSDFTNEFLDDSINFTLGYSVAVSDTNAYTDLVTLDNSKIILSFFDSFTITDAVTNNGIGRLLLNFTDSYLILDANQFNPVVLSNPLEVSNNKGGALVGSCTVVFKDYSQGSEPTPGSCASNFFTVIP